MLLQANQQGQHRPNQVQAKGFSALHEYVSQLSDVQGIQAGFLGSEARPQVQSDDHLRHLGKPCLLAHPEPYFQNDNPAVPDEDLESSSATYHYSIHSIRFDSGQTQRDQIQEEGKEAQKERQEPEPSLERGTQDDLGHLGWCPVADCP